MSEPVGTGLTCPRCKGEDLKVKDSRPSGQMIRRRRLCGDCGLRFTTFEVSTEHEAPPMFAFRAMKLREKLDALTPERRAVVMDLIEMLAAAPIPTNSAS